MIPDDLISIEDINHSLNDPIISFNSTPVIPENLISSENLFSCDNIDDQGDLNIFRSMRRKYHSNPLLGYLNINSFRGDKFRLLRDLITNIPIEILCIDETKLTNDFNDALFFIEGYQFPPYRRDRSSCNTRNIGGGKMVLIKDGLINKRLLDFEIKTAETICLELTIKYDNGLFCLLIDLKAFASKVFFEEV